MLPASVEVGAVVTFDASASEHAHSVQWDAGDGTVYDEPVVEHRYERPGNFRPSLYVTGADGQRHTLTWRLVAHRPLREPGPAHSGAMALYSGAGVLWAVAPDAGSLARVDLEAQTVTHHAVCEQPVSLSRDGGVLGVACAGDDRVLRLDAADGSFLGEHQLTEGASPQAIVGWGGAWWVSLASGDTLHIQPAATNTHPGEVRDLATALTVDPDGALWAPRLRPTPHPGEAPVGVVRKLGDAPAAYPLALDTGPDSRLANRGLFNLVRGAALSPDGGSLYLGGLTANIERGTHRDGQPLTFETTLRATVRVLSVEDGSERPEHRTQIDDQGEVTAATLSPLGNWLWIAHGSTRTVQRLDAYTLDAVGSILEAGHGVDGLIATHSALYVHARLDREVRAYDLSSQAAVPELLWRLPTMASDPVDARVLHGERLFHDAADLRMARDGYLSCSVCHPSGTHDGMVWDFTDRGEGLRRTVDLRGRGGLDMGVLHWTGNFDEVQDFEHDIRNNQGGRGLIPQHVWDDLPEGTPLDRDTTGLSDDLDALAAYVHSLSEPPRSPFPPDPEGEAAFTAEGCATCHNPATLYTDSSAPPSPRHDVGTLTEASGQRLGQPLDGLDTPTLLGAWAAGVWLHDGSAASIEEAIARHQDPLTEAPMVTDPSVIEALARFVRSL